MVKTAICGGSARGSNRRITTKTMLVMKLTVLFLTAGFLNVCAKGLSQNGTFSGDKVPLESVLLSIEKQTGFVALYKEPVIRASRPVTINAENLPLEQFLAQVFRSQPLQYDIRGKSIFISPRPAPEPVSVEPPEPARDTLIEVKAKVVNEKGEPLEGVTVKVKGRTAGVTSDGKGVFIVKASEKDILVISSVGYGAREIAVRGRSSLPIVLKVKNAQLDEVAVVAYGTTTRRESTGSISVVKGKDLENVPSSSLANLLQGRVAGLDVTNVSGSPGSGGTEVTIRGYNSLDVEQGRRFSNPLWVVDGVPLNSFTSPVTGTNLLADINPDMIESVQVLKDASAASLYGSRAANGVIIVTTKKGQKDQKANFAVNASRSFNILPRLPTITIGAAERRLRLAAFLNDQRAYLDPVTQRYIFPTTPLELYQNPTLALIDWFHRGSPIGVDGVPILDSLNPFYNNSTNFFPAYYETGIVTNANIQTYGGSKNMNYGIGFGFYDESGVLKGSGFNRIDLNTTLNITPTDKFHVDLRFNASITDRKRGEKTSTLSASPIIETVPGDPFQLSSLLPGEGSDAWNTILNKLSATKEVNKSVRLRTNFKLSYDFLPGLTASSSIAADYAVHRRNNFAPSYLDESHYSKTLGETGVDLLVLNENLVTYKTRIKGDHNISVIGGLSYEYDRSEYNGGSAQNGPSDNIYYARPGFPLYGTRTNNNGGFGGPFTETIAFQNYLSDLQEKTLVSYFGRLEYNFRQKYLLSASFRRDGSSVFGDNNKWGAFPSIAAGWSFSEENFVKKALPGLDFGKIRAGWGKSGMQFSQNYLALGLLNVGATPFQGNSVITPDYTTGLYNKDLSWEETSQFDLGTDLDFLHNRLSITADYYYRYTDKLLLPVRLPGTINGYLGQWRNAAAVSNEGLELLVSYQMIQKKNLNWKLTLNAARNWNLFVKSNNGQDINADNAATLSTWIIGRPLNGIYVLKTNGFIGDQKNQPVYYNAAGVSNYFGVSPFIPYKTGDYNFVDVNGDGILSNKDVVYGGSALPIVAGGLNSQLQWKNFEFNVLFSFQLGRHIVNAMPLNSLQTDETLHLMHPLLLDVNKAHFWSGPGDNNADFVPVQLDQGQALYSPLVDRWVETVNWTKLKTVVVKYNLPRALIKKWGMEGVSVFGSGENLFTVTNYSGLDPETVNISTGIDIGTNYPLARKFTLGLTFKF